MTDRPILLSAPMVRALPAEDAETWTDDELWQIVNEFDDRTSPEEYPEMIMLNEAEFRDFLDRGRASLKAANAALNAQLAKAESHVEAVKNTLGVRCTDVSFLEERCKMLETELSAPAGYRVIPKQPTDTMVEVMAFNLCSEFGGEFTIANKAFAMAVYKQAWELGIKSDSKPSPRAQALEEAAKVAEQFRNKDWIAHDMHKGVFPTQSEPGVAIAAAIRALSSQPLADHIADASKMVANGCKYRRGERLTKSKGSSWTGHVVGFYSTELTPIGYAIESETEKGSVQIYPEAALRALPASPEVSE